LGVNLDFELLQVTQAHLTDELRQQLLGRGSRLMKPFAIILPNLPSNVGMTQGNLPIVVCTAFICCAGMGNPCRRAGQLPNRLETVTTVPGAIAQFRSA